MVAFDSNSGQDAVEELKPFDIGFVPAGWTRGEALMLRAPEGVRVGIVKQKSHATDITSVSSDGIALLTWSADEVGQVNDWLEWWYREGLVRQ